MSNAQYPSGEEGKKENPFNHVGPVESVEGRGEDRDAVRQRP
jgi:hypothetical protein